MQWTHIDSRHRRLADGYDQDQPMAQADGGPYARQKSKSSSPHLASGSAMIIALRSG